MQPGTAPRRAVPMAALAGLLLVVAGVALASIALGAKPLSPAQVWHGLTDHAVGAYPVVHGMRLPRTALGLLAGAALGVAGSLMQALTRNPIADPGLFGVNAGASAAVVTAVTFLSAGTFDGYVWFALAGAGAVSVLVYLVGGGRRATPVNLALAGTAVNAALFAYVNAAELLDTDSLDKMRFWTAGSLAGARLSTVTRLAPFIAAGLVLALLLARSLNVLALGDDSARALGGRPTATRVGAVVAVTLLCGAATAACGPIVFVGLMVPHLARVLAGTDMRWALPAAALLGAIVLLGCDVVGRLIARPSEIQAGIVTAVVGGAFFVTLARRRRFAA